MEYRTIAHLSDHLWTWSATLPKDFDLIVGVPAGGLFAANLLALYRNLPLAEIEGFLAGRIAKGGERLQRVQHEDTPGAGQKVLVVVDSLPDGGALQVIQERVAAAGLPHQISYGGVYVRRGWEQQVDHTCELLERPVLCEWDLMRAEEMDRICMDIDGVLCCDPVSGMNDDGARYEEFLACARPLHLPRSRVGWLVTSRLEKYRRLTEQWLASHGVQFGELIMMDLPDKRARRTLRGHSVFKAEAYRATGADLFYESELSQAIQIANLALKPVLCVETGQMIYPDLVPAGLEQQTYSKNGGYVAAARKRLRRALGRW